MGYKYTPYSFSKISTYQQCPRKFKYTYIDKIPTEWVDSFATERGKLIHALLEVEGDSEKLKNHNDFKDILKRKILSKDDIRDAIASYKSFVNSKIGKSILSKHRLFAEMPVGLDFDLQYMKYNPSPTEPDSDNLFLRGYIDACFVNIDNPKTALLVDWKTGKVPEKQKYAQLLWYSLGLFGKNPELEKVALAFVYVDHEKANIKEVYRKDIDKYKKSLFSITDKIESDESFVKKESALCSWCPFEEHCQSEDQTISDNPWDT